MDLSLMTLVAPVAGCSAALCLVGNNLSQAKGAAAIKATIAGTRSQGDGRREPPFGQGPTAGATPPEPKWMIEARMAGGCGR